MDRDTAVRLAQQAIKANNKRLVDALLARQAERAETPPAATPDRLPIIAVTCATGWECYAIVEELVAARRFRVRALYRPPGTQAASRYSGPVFRRPNRRRIGTIGGAGVAFVNPIAAMGTPMAPLASGVDVSQFVQVGSAIAGRNLSMPTPDPQPLANAGRALSEGIGHWPLSGPGAGPTNSLADAS